MAIRMSMQLSHQRITNPLASSHGVVRIQRNCGTSRCHSRSKFESACAEARGAAPQHVTLHGMAW